MKVSLLFYIALLLCTISLTTANDPPPMVWTATLRRQAERLADLAAGAYSEAGSSRNRSGKDLCIAKHGGELYGSFSINSDSYGNTCLVDVIVFRNEEEIVIAFRGTTAFTQLLTQAVFFSGANMVDFHGYGSVNEYYNNALNGLWPSIEPVFQKHRNYRVTFTGHSMGGSLAAMAAFRFAILCEQRSAPYYNRSRKQHIQVHTFGAPRHGNPEYARRHNEHVPYSVRYVNRDDGIAHFPQCKDKDSFGSEYCDPRKEHVYVHEGFERWLPNGMARDNIPIMCNGPNEMYLEHPQCSNTISVKWSGIKGHIENHRSYFEHWMFYYGKAGCDQDAYNKLSGEMRTAEQEQAEMEAKKNQ